MNKLSFTFIFFIFSCFYAFGQTVSGKVVDEQQQPIPYATVQLGDHTGVVTNTEGEFTLTLPEGITDPVTISYLGYATLEIPLTDLTKQVYVLKEEVTELDEVLVTNKQLGAQEIVEKMMAAAPDLHVLNDRSQTFFMRNRDDQKLLDFTFEIDKASKTSRSDLKTINKEIETLSKNITGSKFRFFTEYYGERLVMGDSAKLNVEKAVILKDKDRDISAEEITKKLVNTVRPYLDKGASYKVKTGIIKIEDSLTTDEFFEEDIDSVKGKTKFVKNSLQWRLRSHNAFYNEENLDFLQKLKRYTYSLEGYANIAGESVYVIAFEPDRSSASFRGKMYINVFDYGMMRLEYEMLEGEKLQGVNLKLLLGLKFREDRIRVTSEYRKNAEGKYYLKFGRKTSGTYAYISRPMKFIKNKEDRSESRQVFKLDFTFEIDNLSTSEIYIAESNAITAEAFAAFEEPENFIPLEIERYDPAIWEGYNIIAPIQEIREYGKEVKR
ncbi:carboxypeptidase-like regulatory domain-containing protein [Robertkochia sediminum]|uniref:carboxypeptidase-like regulatory domain-containing protein n=1 Tax=Robertkochia sediminum TaxID=2785326 RepID=UPI00193417AB|nr:carboxypeptidase-like regulatory domain-containing protein [Robertkochia sediminum]MBL7471312.1 carboxypeptidase-like regulatory domain-containing protein [Robertkochia sediminum]